MQQQRAVAESKYRQEAEARAALEATACRLLEEQAELDEVTGACDLIIIMGSDL